MIDIPVYCINIERSKDRKEIMLNQFKNNNIDYKFVEGIDGEKITNIDGGIVQNIKYQNWCLNEVNYLKNVKRQEYTIACFFSHVKAIKEAYDSNNEHVIIMEDDISFKYIDMWRYSISKIIERAPKNWSVLKLHTSNNQGIDILNKSYSEWIPWSRQFFSGGFYVMNRKGMEKIVRNFIKNDIYTIGGINCLAADIIIFSIDNDKSTYVYNDCLVINNNVMENLPSLLNNSKWRINLEKQGILYAEKYFKERYINLHLDKIPENLSVKHSIKSRLLTINITLTEPIDNDIKEKITKTQTYNNIFNVEIILKSNNNIICWLTFLRDSKLSNINIELYNVNENNSDANQQIISNTNNSDANQQIISNTNNSEKINYPIPYKLKYLNNYASCRGKIYTNFEDAWNACLVDKNAGGVTKDSNDIYTVRRGNILFDSPVNETSWLKQ